MKYLLLLLFFISCAQTDQSVGASGMKEIGSTSWEGKIYSFDYYTGGMHYKVLTRYKGGVDVINITLDSLQIEKIKSLNHE